MNSLRRRLPQRRSPHFSFWLVFLLGCSLVLEGWIFSTILDKTIGSIRNLWKPGGAPLRVAILRSANSALLSEPNPEDYFETEHQWEIVLNEAGIGFRVVPDEDFSANLAAVADVVVLPSAVCLSDAERSAIRGLAQKGVGIVASGAVGARNASCAWKGWDTLAALTGLKNLDATTLQQESFAGLRGGEFYSEMVPAGYRLSVPAQELIFGSAHQPDIFWSDGRLRPARGNSVDNVALGTHGAYEAARVVWFGFKETLPDSSGKDQRAALNQYLRAAVLWTGRQPLAVLGNWPEHRKAAVMVAETVQDAGAARPAADLLSAEKVPATYFIGASQAKASPAALRALRASGEIASAGDSESAFADEDVDRQTARLRTAKASLEQLGSPTVQGFDPPQQVWDEGTVTALQHAGYSYYFDHSSFERAVPDMMVMPQPKTFLPADPVEVARISAMAASDIEVISQYRGPMPWGDDLAEGFLRDFKMAEYLGGVYTLSFRSDLLGAPENLHILQSLIREIRNARAWIAPGESVTSWWAQRDKVRVETQVVSSTRIRLAVTNRSDKPMLDSSVYVYLPRKPRTVRLQPELLSKVVPKTELLTGADPVLRVDFPRLNPQSGYVCVMVVDED